MHLPSNCPIKSATGTVQKNRKMAVSSACLEAIKLLHQVCAWFWSLNQLLRAKITGILRAKVATSKSSARLNLSLADSNPDKNFDEIFEDFNLRSLDGMQCALAVMRGFFCCLNCCVYRCEDVGDRPWKSISTRVRDNEVLLHRSN